MAITRPYLQRCGKIARQRPASQKGYSLYYAFSDELSDPTNEHFLSVETPHLWLIAPGFQLFREWSGVKEEADSEVEGIDPGVITGASLQILRQCRALIVGPLLAEDPFFSLDNAPAWLGTRAMRHVTAREASRMLAASRSDPLRQYATRSASSPPRDSGVRTASRQSRAASQWLSSSPIPSPCDVYSAQPVLPDLSLLLAGARKRSRSEASLATSPPSSRPSSPWSPNETIIISSSDDESGPPHPVSAQHQRMQAEVIEISSDEDTPSDRRKAASCLYGMKRSQSPNPALIDSDDNETSHACSVVQSTRRHYEGHSSANYVPFCIY
ncbi:hypothetical protein WOLCODRAFT_143161 [Wolfiporia cocos MD-104 SS10]|uniref:Uncharacterized protein n=1 Tax=Wolfiporia cocos (strain MD-104) TaxID=742152 RepID=A0A2H3JWQ6_WOLCO|nr:hypothetical protein WOLCODRAFT_143161 [Wolfiporia cocos MD-104 SS10]